MKFHFQKNKPADYWKDIPLKDWQNLQWQMRSSLKSLQDYQKVFSLKKEEVEAFANPNFQIRTTPYYASLCKDHPLDPIRKILMPNTLETTFTKQEMLDPLGEKDNSPSPRIIHRYSDRLLFLVTDFCSVYCRYCTRKHFTGKEEVFPKKSEYDSALDYIRSKKGVREVILSGGDPLTLSDTKLEKVLSDLRKIEHIEIIRIGTRMPVVCPMRITKNLVEMLAKYQPVYFMLHFNHPKEITFEAKEAIDLLVNHGTPCFNQMVLLNGINNHPAIVQALSRRLLYLRVKPYYMFQCDPSEGTDHLRTSIDQSLEIQKEMWGHLSGLAMPTYAVDIPNGGGKTVYSPNYELEVSKEKRRYKGWDGVKAEYINPSEENLELPIDLEDYEKEWQELKNAKGL